MTRPPNPLRRTEVRRCAVCGCRLKSMSTKVFTCAGCKSHKDANFKQRMRGERQ